MPRDALACFCQHAGVWVEWATVAQIVKEQPAPVLQHFRMHSPVLNHACMWQGIHLAPSDRNLGLVQLALTLSNKACICLQVDEIMAGHNVFLTGCAGTGKSAVVNTVRAALQEKYKSEYSSKVVMTAMTGIAAVLVEGGLF